MTVAPAPVAPAADARIGLAQAVSAYAFWGLLPLFYAHLRHVAALEVVAHRILWSVVVIVVILAARRQLAEMVAAMRDRRMLAPMVASALLIAVNWLVYIWAVTNGHVIAASLGYFLNPLVNVLLGYVVLKERLSRLQWLAVAIAGAGVAVLAGGALTAETAGDGLTTLAVSLTLGLSFGVYGLIRKLAPAGPLIGLGIETLVLLPVAGGFLLWWAALGRAHFGAGDVSTSLLLAAGGPITTIPLLLFASATRKLNYATIGLIQYLSPTIALLLALLALGERATPAQIAAFPLIWSALILYSVDALRIARRAARPAGA